MTWARSECQSCHIPLAARDIIPVVSILVLAGRCRRCGAEIGWFHLWVELAATAIAALMVLVEHDPARVWADCALGWTLLALAWIDWRHFLLPDVLTLPLVLAGLATNMWLDPANITSAAAGAVVGYLSFRGIEIAYRALRHRDGLGQGDAKLMAAAGAWVGLEGLASVVMASALGGIAMAILKYWKDTKLKDGTIAELRVPLGVSISLAFWVIYIFGTFKQGP